MKKIIITIMVTIFILHTHAQIEWNDSVRNVSITGYAGILAGPKISTTNWKTSGFVTFRAGGTVTFTPKKWISFYGLGVGEVDETGVMTPLYLIGIKFKPAKIITITVGKMASPMTELRPLPTTMSGQFEPWTKSKILGSALGGKIAISPKENFSLTAGGYWRNTDASVEFGLGFPYVKVVGYYMLKSKSFGMAATGSYKWFSETVVYNYKQNFAFLTGINVPKTSGISLYSDVGFDANNWKFVRGEWGILKGFSYKVVHVLIGAGYSQEVHSVKGYVMVTL